MTCGRIKHVSIFIFALRDINCSVSESKRVIIMWGKLKCFWRYLFIVWENDSEYK